MDHIELLIQIEDAGPQMRRELEKLDKSLMKNFSQSHMKD